MSFAANRDVRLYYETFGAPGAEPVLLINGAGSQCIDFGEAFCERLAGAGFRVIRFDPRDTGLSTALVDHPSRLVEVFAAVRAGGDPPLAYGLEDLADDAFAVLQADGCGPAHLFGRSLGSAVAQAMAIRRPERVLSLTLAIAFSRGLADTMSADGLAAIEAEVFTEPEAFVARRLRTARAIGSPAYFDEARIVSEAERAFARGVHAGGGARHFAVGVAAPDLRPQLYQVAAPALIIHGALDRVVPLAYAQETLAALPGARLEVLDDMGHDGPPQLQDRWADLFIAHAAAVRARAASI